MKRERELAGRISALRGLRDAIGAMKDLSAHHFREVRAAIEPARAYREGVDRVIGKTAVHVPAGDGPSGLVVVGGELGLCGGYNAELARAGSSRGGELGGGPVFAVGHRTAAMLARQGIHPERTYAAPASARGITELVLRLAEDVLGDYVGKNMASLDIVSSRFDGVGICRPVETRLLPMQPPGPQSTRATPYISASRIEAVAARERLYITLYDLLLDALASEHAARLVATQSAEQWLDERIERLRRHWISARREAGTQEVIEIAAGVRARDLDRFRERRLPRENGSTRSTQVLFDSKQGNDGGSAG
jgi:F-type H+-transporting ATPase subunit gamma